MADNAVGNLNSYKEVEWKIPDFEAIDLNSIDKTVISPDFTFNGFKFSMKVLGANQRRNKSVFLEVKSSKLFHMQCSLSLKLSDGTLFGSEDATNIRINQCFPDFIKKSLLEERRKDFLPDNVLTLVVSFCDGEKQRAVKKRKYKHEEDKIYTNLELLSRDLHNMFDDKDTCDVNIKIGSKVIKAHSVILKTRAPILGLALKHNTVEKIENTILIQDECDPDAFEQYISYVYSGVLNIDSPRKGTELYVIAHKYDCDEIKKFCVQYLVGNICAENVCNLIEFSMKYDEAYLNKRAADFFNQNVTDVLETEEWARFIARDSTLATILLKNMTKFRFLD